MLTLGNDTRWRLTHIRGCYTSRAREKPKSDFRQHADLKHCFMGSPSLSAMPHTTFLLLLLLCCPVLAHAQLPARNPLLHGCESVTLLAHRPFATVQIQGTAAPVLDRVAFLGMSTATGPGWLPNAGGDSAFFCRLEVQIERKTRFPVRFRLGDVNYVDYLEGKRAAW